MFTWKTPGSPCFSYSSSISVNDCYGWLLVTSYYGNPTFSRQLRSVCTTLNGLSSRILTRSLIDLIRRELRRCFFTSTMRLVTVILRFAALLQYPVIKVSTVWACDTLWLHSAVERWKSLYIPLVRSQWRTFACSRCEYRDSHRWSQLVPEGASPGKQRKNVFWTTTSLIFSFSFLLEDLLAISWPLR